MTYDVQIVDIVLKKIEREYAELMDSGIPISMQELLNFDLFRLDEYCNTFRPSSDTTALVEATGEYCARHGVWLDTAPYYVTNAPFMFPYGDYDRMLLVTKNLSIDYYLNDVMGREKFRWLSLEEQLIATKIIQRMTAVDENLYLAPEASSVEAANIEVLKGMQYLSPPEWFVRFVRCYSYHIGITHQDGNAASLGRVISVQEYIERRNHIAGMHHALMLSEFCDGAFLDWSWLSSVGIAYLINKIRYTITTFGTLVNDLFSFEKEVIDDKTDANLVVVLGLNNPSLPLRVLFEEAAAIIRRQLIEFISLQKQLWERCKELAQGAPQMSALLAHHLDTLEHCLQACWVWQAYTRRYKREHSIWRETTLNNSHV